MESKPEFASCFPLALSKLSSLSVWVSALPDHSTGSQPFPGQVMGSCKAVEITLVSFGCHRKLEKWSDSNRHLSEVYLLKLHVPYQVCHLIQFLAREG